MQHPADEPALGQQYVEDVQQRRLADLDTFTDWLVGECMGKHAVTSDFECRTEARLQAAPVATLLHAALTAAQAGDDALAGRALRLLNARHFDAFDSVIYQDASAHQSHDEGLAREAA